MQKTRLRTKISLICKAVARIKALECDQMMQDPNPRVIDDSLVGFKFEMCFEFDMDKKGKEKNSVGALESC